MRISFLKASIVLSSAVLFSAIFTLAASPVSADTVQSQAGINVVGTAGTGADGGNTAVAYQQATTSATGDDSFEGSGNASVSTPAGQGASITTQSPGGALSASVVAGDQSGAGLDASVSASGGDGLGDGTGEDEGLFASSYAFASATPPDELPDQLSLILGQNPDATHDFRQKQRGVRHVRIADRGRRRTSRSDRRDIGEPVGPLRFRDITGRRRPFRQRPSFEQYRQPGRDLPTSLVRFRGFRPNDRIGADREFYGVSGRGRFRESDGCLVFRIVPRRDDGVRSPEHRFGDAGGAVVLLRSRKKIHGNFRRPRHIDHKSTAAYALRGRHCSAIS